MLPPPRTTLLSTPRRPRKPEQACCHRHRIIVLGSASACVLWSAGLLSSPPPPPQPPLWPPPPPSQLMSPEPWRAANIRLSLAEAPSSQLLPPPSPQLLPPPPPETKRRSRYRSGDPPSLHIRRRGRTQSSSDSSQAPSAARGTPRAKGSAGAWLARAASRQRERVAAAQRKGKGRTAQRKASSASTASTTALTSAASASAASAAAAPLRGGDRPPDQAMRAQEQDRALRPEPKRPPRSQRPQEWLRQWARPSERWGLVSVGGAKREEEDPRLAQCSRTSCLRVFGERHTATNWLVWLLYVCTQLAGMAPHPLTSCPHPHPHPLPQPLPHPLPRLHPRPRLALAPPLPLSRCGCSIVTST